MGLQLNGARIQLVQVDPTMHVPEAERNYKSDCPWITIELSSRHLRLSICFRHIQNGDIS